MDIVQQDLNIQQIIHWTRSIVALAIRIFIANVNKQLIKEKKKKTKISMMSTCEAKEIWTLCTQLYLQFENNIRLEL